MLVLGVFYSLLVVTGLTFDLKLHYMKGDFIAVTVP